MSLKFEVTEDVSEGLDKLQVRVSKDMEDILSEMMYRATGRPGDMDAPIPKRIEDNYNPYLYLSGQDKNYWTFDINADMSSVTANYSGFQHRSLRPSDDEFMVWWEFSEEYYEGMPNDEWYELVYRTDPTERTLDRDYAFYQETGVDRVADPKDAKHQGFVNRGMGDAADHIGYALNSNIKRILNLL